ncbi:MAG: DUF429 domain-containing protein [Gemmataceae bacterium]
MSFAAVQGIDFSGARQAGSALWWATLVPEAQRWRLARLTSLAALAGTTDRARVLASLRQAIALSEATLWAFDFSFALPAVLLGEATSWRAWLVQLAQQPDDAPAFGRFCATRAFQQTGRSCVLRQTEQEQGAHLCAYHPHLVYQLFYGVREVLRPLSTDPSTAILPFDYERLPQARRFLVETLPAATLRRLGWPDRGYKGGGRNTRRQSQLREELVGQLAKEVAIESEFQEVMRRQSGGDALDAVLAAWGAIAAWKRVNHAALASNPTYQREGYEYC